MMIFGHFDPKMMIFGHFDPKMIKFTKKLISIYFDRSGPRLMIFGHFDPKMMIFGHFDPKMMIFGHFDPKMMMMIFGHFGNPGPLFDNHTRYDIIDFHIQNLYFYRIYDSISVSRRHRPRSRSSGQGSPLGGRPGLRSPF